MTDQRNIAAPQDAALAFRGYGRALRSLVLPLRTLAVIGGIAAAGVVESRAERPATCGLAITVQDPTCGQASSGSTGSSRRQPARPALSTATGTEATQTPARI
jgi:hypothetical protein